MVWHSHSEADLMMQEVSTLEQLTQSQKKKLLTAKCFYAMIPTCTGIFHRSSCFFLFFFFLLWSQRSALLRGEGRSS